MCGTHMPYVYMLATGALYLARNESWGHVYLALLLPAILALNVAYTGFTGLVSEMVDSEQVSLFPCERALSGSRVEGLGFSRCSLADGCAGVRFL
jgi:hypothetical protein